MFTANIGSNDRIIRLVIGLALVIWVIMDHGLGPWNWVKLGLGVFAIGTAALNFCPVYRVLGIKTN